MEHLVDWERAEVSRSAHEASGTDLEQLRVDPKEMARYQSPPPNMFPPGVCLSSGRRCPRQDHP